MFHPGTEVEYGIHEDCVQCQMANRFAAGMFYWLLNADRKKTLKKENGWRTCHDANGIQKAYSVCLSSRAAVMLCCGCQQIRDVAR